MAGNAEVKVAIVADNSDLTRTLSQSQGKLASWGAAVGKIALAAGIAGAAGVAVLGKASIDAASQAQQSLGATETVFGKFSDNVVKTSDRAAEALGLSANQYRENANILGSLLGNQGVAQDKLAGKTRSLIKTGADLAATFGGTTTDAVNALASAFKGEFDPLEQYGISIKQSAINTEAYAVAGVKTKAAFDDLSTAQQNAAKQQATTNLLTKQASKTQGAFAKETDTLAHQQQVLGAQVENLKTKIGNALLPAATDFVKLLNDRLVPALSDAADKYLPRAQAAIENLFSGDTSAKASKFADQFEGIDWDSISTSAGELADTLKDLGPALADLSVEGVNDGFKVFGAVVGFAADHVDELRTALPYIVAGFIALKGAQTLNQIAGRDSLLGMAAQLYTTRQLISANRELAGTIREVNGAQGIMTGGIATATGGMSKLKLAAAGAAGIGGLAAVTASTQIANDKVSGLLSVLGSAAMGAAAGSVFGPWGTAIGGVVGGLGGLVGAIGKSGDAMEEAKPPASEYASALDRLTGASTEAARAEAYRALQGSKVLDDLNSFGISSRQAVDAIMGNKTALGEVNAALTEQSTIYQIDKQRLDDLTAARETDQALLASGAQLSAKDLKAIEKRTAGRDEEIAALEESTGARKAAIDAIGDEVGRRKAASKAVRDEADAVHVYSDEINKLPRDKRTLIKADNVATTVKDIARLVEKYDLARRDVKTLIAASGVPTTVRQVQSVIDRLAAVHDKTVTLTVRTNRIGGVTSSAGGHSSDPDSPAAPPRVVAERGRTDGKTYAGAFGQGVEDVARKQSLLEKLFGAKPAQAGLDQIKSGLEAAASMIDRVVGKRIKDAQKAGKLEQRIVDALKAQGKRLRENGALQDKIAGKLDEAKTAAEGYAAAIRESVVAFGDITQLGKTDTGKVTLAKLLKDLGKRAADAREFNQLLQQLAAAGLDKTQIEQLTAAGPEAALATARAIAQGGAYAIDKVNEFSRDIGASGTALGTALSDRFAIAGQTSAYTYISTLEGTQDRLDKTAKKMAKAYVTELQEQLAKVGAGQGKTPDTGNGNGNDRVRVTLSSQQVSQLERGREIQLDLDAYRAAGGRSRA
jgi:hypothetical protein